MESLKLASQLLSLRRSQWWDATRIAEYQQDKLVTALRFALNSVEHYRRLDIDPKTINSTSDIMRFPVLIKQDVQNSRLDLLSDGTSLDDCRTSTTSGSTGEPTTTAFDRDTWRLCKYALKIRRLLSYGIGIGKRVLLVSELHPDEINDGNNQKFPGEGLIFGRRQISIHDPVHKAIPAIQEYKPHALYAFPSFLKELLDYCDANSVSLPKVDVIFTSSEVLSVALRSRLERHFGAAICDVYGSTELKEVAWQCSSGKYHINFESIWVEIGDDDSNDGSGPVLLTSLINRAMPLIRYRVGDRARMGEGGCDCGRESPWLSTVSGREVDMVLLPDGRRMSPYLLTSIIESDRGIQRYQIVQNSIDQIEVRYMGADGHSVNTEALSTLLAEVLGDQVQLGFAAISAIPRTVNGKQMVFSRKFDLPK